MSNRVKPVQCVAFVLMLCAEASPARAADEIVGVGNFSHIVQNLDRSLEFYRDVLGLEVTANQPDRDAEGRRCPDRHLGW